MEVVRHWLAVLLVISIPPAIGWWFLIHPFAGFWRRLGPWVSLAVIGVLFMAALVGLFVVRERLLGPDLGTHWTTIVPGLALLSVAGWISLRRRRSLTMPVLVGVPELDPDDRGELLTEGLYARTRNPRYLEIWLGLGGYSLIANHVGPYLFFLASFPLIHLVVLLEERELEDRFGEEFRAYRRRVPRYLLRRTPADPPHEGDPP